MMRKERVEAADVVQIYQLWNEYAAAINAQNMERWVALWSDNGIQMPPDAPQRSGTAEILRDVEALEEHFPKAFSISPDVVHILGDHAFSHGTFSFLLTIMEGDATKRISGKFLSVLKKQDDGAWKVLVDCFNYDSARERDHHDSIL